jgi:hypothetical protein
LGSAAAADADPSLPTQLYGPAVGRELVGSERWLRIVQSEVAVEANN